MTAGKACAYVESLGDDVFFSREFLKTLFARCVEYRNAGGITAQSMRDEMKRAESKRRAMEYNRDAARARVQILERQVADMYSGLARLAETGRILQMQYVTTSRRNEELAALLRRNEAWNRKAHAQLRVVTADTQRVNAYVSGTRERVREGLNGVREVHATALRTFQGLTRSAMADALEVARPALTLTRCLTVMDVMSGRAPSTRVDGGASNDRPPE